MVVHTAWVAAEHYTSVYNTDFVRRNTHSNTDSNTQTNSGPVTTATISIAHYKIKNIYIKNVIIKIGNNFLSDDLNKNVLSLFLKTLSGVT